METLLQRLLNHFGQAINIFMIETFSKRSTLGGERKTIYETHTEDELGEVDHKSTFYEK